MDENAETSPQAEKVRGFTRLYHDLNRHLIQLDIASKQLQAVYAILMETTGLNKEESRLSISYLAGLLNCNRRYLVDVLRDLVDRKIIKERFSGQYRYLSVNENVEEWTASKSDGGSKKKRETGVLPDTSNKKSGVLPDTSKTGESGVLPDTSKDKTGVLPDTRSGVLPDTSAGVLPDTTFSETGVLPDTRSGVLQDTTQRKKEELKNQEVKERKKEEEKTDSLSIPVEPFSYTGKMDVLACMKYYQLDIKGFAAFEHIRSYQGLMEDELIHAAIKIAFQKQDVYCKGVLVNWNKKGYRKVSEVPELKKGGGGNGGIPVAGGVNQGNRMGRANRPAAKAPEFSEEESAALDKRLKELLRRQALITGGKLPE